VSDAVEHCPVAQRYQQYVEALRQARKLQPDSARAPNCADSDSHSNWGLLRNSELITEVACSIRSSEIRPWMFMLCGTEKIECSVTSQLIGGELIFTPVCDTE
jgi:hypothetical protein